MSEKDVLTVKEFRKYLDDMESKWTEEDIEYLGEFDLTPIRVDNSRGICNAEITYDITGLGIILFPKEA